MELFSSDKYFVLLQDENSLWINRENGTFSTKTGQDAVENNPTLCMIGIVYGFIGTLRLSLASEPRIVFIRSRELVCKIKDKDVYKITSVVAVPLESECEIEVECSPSRSLQEGSFVSYVENVTSPAPTGNTSSLSPMSTTSHRTPTNAESPAASPAAGNVTLNKVRIGACPNSNKYGGRFDKTERRLLDEYYKMFMEADSFYYSNEYNIFNSLQRETLKNDKASKETKENKEAAESKMGTDMNGSDSQFVNLSDIDERFFWNKYMLQDLSQETFYQDWAIPVLHGSIQHQICELDSNSANLSPKHKDAPMHLELYLLSRRSRHRAGMRYLKRGVDEQGKVANYVETEQMIVFRGHMISFVQTRGSVPVFWSQPGYKYRPPIRLDKTFEESLPTFEMHLEEERKTYGPLCLVNLVEKVGRERVLEEYYRKCVLSYNSEDISYVSFDFHDKCRGLKFENVKLLVESITDIIKGMAYCWVDSYGLVMQQNGTFRVNCVDCLDRTNVVQSFLAREVLTLQLSRIGLLLPEVGLSETIRRKFLEVWANNGDIISKQYAGTNALKGDFTRTGERRFAGVMRDGMNSANRYLNNRLKDGTRQACIDLILGVRSSVSEEELSIGKEAVEEKDSTESILQMMDDVRHCLVPAQTTVIGSWGLLNVKVHDMGSVDIDTVLILTENECYVAIYDWSLETVASSTKINLGSITSLELMNEPVSQLGGSSVWVLFHSSAHSSSQSFIPSLKLHFVTEDESCDYFHFRSSNLRFFNNCLTQIRHPDEMMEALKLLAETVKAAVFSSSKKCIPVVTTAPALSKPIAQKGGHGINAWIPRWNTGTSSTTPSATDEHPSLKFGPSSIQRFTPGFLKKKRAEDASAKLSEGATEENNRTMSHPQTLEVSQQQFNPTYDISSTLSVTPQHHSRTPMEPCSTLQTYENPADYFLQSCGIVSVTSVRPTSTPSDSDKMHLDVMSRDYNFLPKTSPGLSPVTSTMDDASQSQAVTPSSTDTNLSSVKLHIPHELLQRHRYSLPANNLDMTMTTLVVNPGNGGSIGMQIGSGRSTTPEIKVTEEAPQANLLPSFISQQHHLTVANNQKRMSRSSEDINKVPTPEVVGIVNKSSQGWLNYKLPVASFKQKLVPSLPQDSRSTSDQDIFLSFVHMKGSHSENAIKEGTRPGDAGAGNNPVPKAAGGGVVFTPLGKLARGMQSIGANYLDPRKLRDTLRQPKQDNAPVEDPKITELMKATKSRIIDI